MCRPYGDTVMDVQIWKFQSLVNQYAILCHLLDFLVHALQSGYCLGFEKGVFGLVYGISSHYLGGLGFVRFALNCSLLSVLAAFGYRAVNCSFHEAAVFVHLC
uniref:Uncharacterized protein n=1 Tax=Spongospora subterranea TaxID=70186 RepID=A0A0H5R0T3_9EUKA|eukprot:CRZ07816.1 hypothetical protein [Spongospora subterranea]